MKSIAQLAGLVGGYVIGTVMIAQPLAAALGTSSVTWTASSCPAGNYAITATATHNGTGQSYDYRSNVLLPRTDVTAQFSDLPAGSYAVHVEVRRGDGLSFTASESLNVSAVSAGGAMGGGGRRAADRTITGTAVPRQPGTGTTPSTPLRPWDSRASNVKLQAPAVAAPPAAAPAADGTSILRAIFSRMYDLRTSGHEWDQVDLIDADEDGRPDALTVHFVDGTVMTWVLPR